MNKMLAEEIYYDMVLGRTFELAAKEHYMGGDIAGFLHLDFGQEGFSVAAMKAFDKGDVFTTYREHVMAIARGMDPKDVMAELFGKTAGVSHGRGGSMHLFDPSHFFYGGDAIVGGQIPNAVGCAYARKYQGRKDGVMVIFGDGATNGGAFFESINNASTQKLPLLFLCENNGYAIGTKITRVAPFEKQAKKAEPYMITREVDGMDAIAVYEAVREAQSLIEDGHGPVFLEAMTCRYEGHSVADANTYRSKEEMQICKGKDSIDRMEQLLLSQYGITSDTINAMQKRAQDCVDEAVAFAASAAEPELAELYEDIFAERKNHVVS